ncbi:MAG: outer spore coat protein CotE [Candidatus Coprovivens sp.]
MTHHFKGSNKKNEVTVNGSFDINVWYSYNNDTKTTVTTKTINYDELLRIRVKDYDSLANDNEIIVRSLKQPTVQDVKIKNGEVNLTVNKELGVEIVGESKVKIAALEDELPWDDIYDEDPQNIEVEEDYLEDSETVN